MLKRLLFAVFVLGLVFSLSGTAISGIGEKPVEGLNPIPTVNPNAQLYNDIGDARPAGPSWRPPTLDVQQLPDLGAISQPNSQNFCDYIWYHGAGAAYAWGIPSSSTREVFATRFTVDAGWACSLYTGWAFTYGGFMTGTPSVRMYLYEDDGFGLPGNKLDSGDVAYADLPTGAGWIAVDWTNGPWIFEDGAEYHIGWAVLGDGINDKYHLISDDCVSDYAGEERSTLYIAADAAWYTVLDFYADCDYGWWIESEACCYELPYSDCYSQSWDDGIAYYWRAPHPAYDIIDYGQRFTVSGIETLSSVDLPIYDMGATPPNVSGNDDIIVTIWDDDGFGYPGTVLATEILPAGTYPFFPTFATVDFYSHGLVFDGSQSPVDFYVTFNSSGAFPNDCEATLSDDETTPNGRSYCFYGGGWWKIGDLFGIDVDMNFTANLCKDPYNDCYSQNFSTGLAYYWTLPDAYGDVADAQRFKASGQDCKVLEVSWALYDFNPGVAYAFDSKVSIYSDVGGLPGVELASVTLTPADYVLFPGVTTVDFTSLDVHVTDYYWAAIESFAPTEAEGIATLTDFGGSNWFDGAAELWNGYWGLLCVDWGGIPCDIAFEASASVCCWPFDERNCADVVTAYGAEWTTHQQNQERTGASGVSFGDAQCDLNVLWYYTHPTYGIYDTGPAIVGDKIVCAFSAEVQVFDLVTGALQYTVTPGAASSIIRHVPFVANGVMYVGGDDQQSISAYDFATGALIWSRNIGTVGPGGLFGPTRYTSFNLINQGGTDVLYWGTDDGNIVAAEAATGNLWAGWAVNPVALGQSVRKSGSTDGFSLYYNTFPGGVDGDVYSVDAATGTVNWQLSTSGGLQAAALFPEGPQLGEGFPGGNSNEAGVIYVNSDIAAPYYPGDGVFYAINAVDGTIKYAVPSMGARGASASGTPVIDKARVYVVGDSYWLNVPVGGRVAAFQKNNGTLIWAYDSPEYNNYWGDAALSCEPGGVDDLLFVAGHHGFINTLNSATGDEIYRRRVTDGGYPNSVALAFAMGSFNGESYLAMSDFWGSIYVSRKGLDRGRLELQSYNPAVPVEFGTATSLHVPIPGLFVNTGCADLTVNNITIDENPTHPWIPPDFAAIQVREEVMDKAASITDKLTEGFNQKTLVVNDDPDLDDYFSIRDRDRGERMMNLGANAIPAFIQTATYPDGVVSPADGSVIAAGDTVDLVIDVNQSLINRGPQDFYAVIDTDDDDFYLKPGTFGPPEIHVTLVGGCLIDTVSLFFGMGAANIHNVTNTGRIATGDDWMDPWGMDIDGDNHAIFQGAFVWAVSQYELAINTQAWHGQGEEASYYSHQADPNWCDNSCSPLLEEGVNLYCLGGYTTDGITYTPITGNRVCKTYIDSVQNFDLGGGWNWENFGAPFDNNLTMGLIANTRTIGAVDFAPFKDLTIEIMEITERNGNPVTGWKMGATMDYDVGGDEASYSAEGSAAWVTSGGTGDVAWGMIKFPFGCGTNPNVDFNPMKNARTLFGYGAWWNDIYLDSAYAFMSAPQGVSSQDPTLGGDEEAHFTIAEHDWAGGDTYELAVAQFGLHGITGGSDAEIVALAKLANKWVGFGRGDVDNNGTIDLADVGYLVAYLGGGPGPIPFMHLGDVDCDGDVDGDDDLYLANYLYAGGPCPCGDWCF